MKHITTTRKSVSHSSNSVNSPVIHSDASNDVDDVVPVEIDDKEKDQNYEVEPISDMIEADECEILYAIMFLIHLE